MVQTKALLSAGPLLSRPDCKTLPGRNLSRSKEPVVKIDPPSAPLNPIVDSTVVTAALTELARSGLANAPIDLIKLIAIDIWYGAEVRDLSLLHGPQHKDMLFLVERLTYYNVVPQQKKKALIATIRHAGGTFLDLQNPVLEALFNSFLPELQPMQTRHFQLPLSECYWSRLDFDSVNFRLAARHPMQLSPPR